MSVELSVRVRAPFRITELASAVSAVASDVLRLPEHAVGWGALVRESGGPWSPMSENQLTTTIRVGSDDIEWLLQDPGMAADGVVLQVSSVGYDEDVDCGTQCTILSYRTLGGCALMYLTAIAVGELAAGEIVDETESVGKRIMSAAELRGLLQLSDEQEQFEAAARKMLVTRTNGRQIPGGIGT